MTMFGLALVLTAAFCHAIWNFFVKRINGGPELVWLFSFVSLIIYFPMVLYIFVVQKPVFGFWQILFMLGTVSLHLSYFLLLQLGYRKGDLSLVYPTARAVGLLLSSGFAVLVLGEYMTLQHGLGAVAVIIGIFFLSGGFKKNVRHATTSILFGLMIGVLIGTYTVWDAYAVSTLLVSPLLLDYAGGVGRTVLLAPVAWRRKELVAGYWRDHRFGVIAIAIFNVLAYVLVLYALTFTPIIYVAPTRELSVLITVIMGSILLKEGDLQRRLGWAMVILVGVMLIAAA